MQLKILKSKLHNARVTDSDIDYVGSVTIDLDLMDAVGIKSHELVSVCDKTTGARIETYVLAGERGSKIIAPMGPAARVIHKNDTVVIMAFAYLEEHEVENHRPKVAILNNENEIIQQL